MDNKNFFIFLAILIILNLVFFLSRVSKILLTGLKTGHMGVAGFGYSVFYPSYSEGYRKKSLVSYYLNLLLNIVILIVGLATNIIILSICYFRIFIFVP